EIAKKNFKMKSKEIDYDLLDHYLKSRPLKWFERNQLMFCKVNFSSSDYYENEYYLIRYLEKSVSKMFLAFNIITNKKLPSDRIGFSTRVVNNWQTTDIYHYLVFTKVKGKLVPECVPIHNELSNSIELSKINIDIPITLSEDVRIEIDKINKFIDCIYRNCIENFKNKKNKEWYFYDKLRRSLTFFVRSYQSRYKEDSVIYLSIAFEMIYCDGLKNNLIQLLCTNLSSMLPHRIDEIFYDIGSLYNSRSGVAHEGTARECNLEKCREIYVDALNKVSVLINTNKINVNTDRPFTTHTENYFKEKAGFCPLSKS
ncbi:MAG: HEPN domain-containing protein, partial [Paeniclostridium sordellii]|nr:HEPN domain-containing protein [Paeniclostridium sordellii]